MNLLLIIRLVVFSTLNFGALAIGGIFTGKGVPSLWYQNLNKAPWTPPGWAFGAAWTTIMIAFSIYMAYAWETISKRNILVILFVMQWILNVMWSPVFFHFHNLMGGAIIITLLLLVIAIFQFAYIPQMKNLSYLITPYFIWLIVATSLNMYSLFNN